ncbi:amyloid beta precursor like protein 2-like isoform X3 [Panonychus citri]|uniref:amyloid beta precursor like protein 2-like isoform X3 n=1 Tax=Panonychus citri TaxID=50023 RepID=UPI0023075203|nr:amyloid beta precursor like protein 2-like isoform X3 [Panonychus citri]
MKLKSFGMLLPCGVGIFGGVEFVCCPAWSTTTSPPELVTLGTEKKQLENQITYKDAEDNDLSIVMNFRTLNLQRKHE